MNIINVQWICIFSIYSQSWCLPEVQGFYYFICCNVRKINYALTVKAIKNSELSLTSVWYNCIGILQKEYSIHIAKWKSSIFWLWQIAWTEYKLIFINCVHKWICINNVCQSQTFNCNTNDTVYYTTWLFKRNILVTEVPQWLKL